MNATGVETIPTTWDDERDDAFFRITRLLFSPAFASGASVLLAGYDEDLVTAGVSPSAGTPTSHTASSPAQPSHLTAR